MFLFVFSKQQIKKQNRVLLLAFGFFCYILKSVKLELELVCEL